MNVLICWEVALNDGNQLMAGSAFVYMNRIDEENLMRAANRLMETEIADRARTAGHRVTGQFVFRSVTRLAPVSEI